MSSRKHKMERVAGGEAFKWSVDMASVSMTQQHWDAVRSGELAKSWFADVADACWKACREMAIAQVYASMHSAAMFRGGIRVSLKPDIRMASGHEVTQP